MLFTFKSITTLAVLFPLFSIAQPASYSFRHLTTADGLSDGVVRNVAQDGYGFMWFGSVNGLTIYNGYTAKVVEADAKNGFALKDNSITALCKDNYNTMWVAQPSGLYQYHYQTGRFLYQPETAGMQITRLYTTGDSLLYLLTKTGLRRFNIKTAKLLPLPSDITTRLLFSNPVKDACSDKNGLLYFAADTGIIRYDPAQQKAMIVKSKERIVGNLSSIAIDKNSGIWFSDGRTIYNLNTYAQMITLPLIAADNQPTGDNKVNDLFTDSEGRVWVAASRTGIGLFNEGANKFTAFTNDPLQAGSLSTNIVNSIFQSNDGTLWIGTEGYGVNYFNPSKAFFHSLLPSYHQTPTLPDNWCRAADEDAKGHWWLATATGVAVYNPATNKYSVFQNKDGRKKKLYVNSVRSVLCASDGTVWIGTADGLNRYHPQSAKMDFIGEKEGMPLSFYWNITEDSNHKIWIACRNGIYTYNPINSLFDDNQANSLLKPYCRFRTKTIFIDSRKRMWFGFDGKGLLLYDQQKGNVRYWQKSSAGSSISDDFVTSVTEDKNGIVWVSTAYGLNAYNPSTDSFQQYYKAGGLPSNNIASLLVDAANRLWMGTSKGLCMLDGERKYFKKFGTEDGLVSEEFNDQAATRMRNDLVVYPTLKGFLYFNPALYQTEKVTLKTYLTSFRVYNNDYPLNTNLEDVKQIDLAWNQSFFSFAVAAADYSQTKQTMYAYWLEPFDKGWIYSKDRTRNYTNVPGGKYIMHFKATTDPQDWNVPEKTIAISIGTVFYKTWWFITAMCLLFLSALYGVYRYRLHQHRQLLLLQSKATVLEKEKTLALYESLKQKLNPHFLFNSLSSLSGLIQKDQGAAKIFLDRLSKIYRYILKSGESEVVRISEDVKLALIYVQLQQTRFGIGLQLQVNINDEYLNQKIVPVTLQNLIENAIKHNVIDADTPLLITITATEEFVVVQNNLQKKSFVEGSNQQGLKNMKSLYRYLCGRAVVIEETPGHFTVKIPFV